VHFLSFFDLSVQDNFLKALAVNVFREIVFELYFLISCAFLAKTAKHAAKLVFLPSRNSKQAEFPENPACSVFQLFTTGYEEAALRR